MILDAKPQRHSCPTALSPVSMETTMTAQMTEGAETFLSLCSSPNTTKHLSAVEVV